MKLRLIGGVVLILSFLGNSSGQSQDSSSKSASRPALAFLSLESIAKGIRTARDKTARDAPNKDNKPSGNQAQAVTLEQYRTLYRVLGQLQRTRASYIETLTLYVTGQKQHLNAANVRKRHERLFSQVEELRSNLDQLTAAFDPLRITLDFQAPDVGSLIEGYVESKQARRVSLGLIDELSVVELEQLQAQAVQNGRMLDVAIKSLRDFILKKYPEISKVA